MNPLRTALLILLLLAEYSGEAVRLKHQGIHSDFLRVETLLFADNRSVCLGVTHGTGILINWQNASNQQWKGWQTLGGPEDFKDVRGAVYADQSLAVFAIRRDGQVSFKRQLAPEGDWNAWQLIGGVIGFSQVEPILDSNGKATCFALASGLVWVNTQTDHVNWRGWKHMPGVSGISFLRSRASSDGSLEVYAGGMRSGSWINQQSANAKWGGWQPAATVPPPQPIRTMQAPALFCDTGNEAIDIKLWASDGAAFSPAATNRFTGYAARNVANHIVSADVNGDSRTDIVVAHQNADGTMHLDVFLSDGISQKRETWFKSGSFSMSNVDGRMVSGDFNGDGKDDIALMYEVADIFRIYRFLSTGKYFTYDVASFAGYSAQEVEANVAASDVNGDGRADIITARQYPDGTMRLHVFFEGTRYEGENGWFKSGPFDLSNVAGRMAGGDFDGNGKGDVIILYGTRREARIYRFLSSGRSFKPDVTTISGQYLLSKIETRMAVGDVDADGKSDLVTAYQDSDGTMRFDLFLEGKTRAGGSGWYQGGPFDLSRVNGRLLMGRWTLDLNLFGYSQKSP